jgi:hypothetical protein
MKTLFTLALAATMFGCAPIPGRPLMPPAIVDHDAIAQMNQCREDLRPDEDQSICKGKD